MCNIKGIPGYTYDFTLLGISWPVVYSRACSVDQRIRCLHPVYCISEHSRFEDVCLNEEVGFEIPLNDSLFCCLLLRGNCMTIFLCGGGVLDPLGS